MHKTRLKTLQPSHCKANKIFYRILATFLHLQRARRSWNVLSVFLAKKADLLANPKDLPANREKTTHCHFSWIFWQIFGICWQIWIFFVAMDWYLIQTLFSHQWRQFCIYFIENYWKYAKKSDLPANPWKMAMSRFFAICRQIPGICRQIHFFAKKTFKTFQLRRPCWRWRKVASIR